MMWAGFAGFRRQVNRETVMTGKNNIVQVTIHYFIVKFFLIIQFNVWLLDYSILLKAKHDKLIFDHQA